MTPFEMAFLWECIRWRRAAMYETLNFRPTGRPRSIQL